MNEDVHPPVFQEEFPLLRASTRNVRKTVTETKPPRSKERTCSVRYSRWITIVAKIPRRPTGTLTSKIVCQLQLSTRYPPARGPSVTDAAAAMAQNPRAVPRR